MSKIFNIYCDESCHLESSKLTIENRFMVLGGIVCPNDRKDIIFKQIKKIKKDNGLNPLSEIKWIKISKPKLNTYKQLINYFFTCEDLSLRSILIDKEQLDHKTFFQTHDEFYYKMYFLMLKWFFGKIIFPNSSSGYKYNIYLDIKDTLGKKKIQKLKEVLFNKYGEDWVNKIQEVRSQEIALMQITDLVIGAIAYANRYPKGGKSSSKNAIVSFIKALSGESLIDSTYHNKKKFNLFKWEGEK